MYNISCFIHDSNHGYLEDTEHRTALVFGLPDLLFVDNFLELCELFYRKHNIQDKVDFHLQNGSNETNLSCSAYAFSCELLFS